MFGLMNSIYVVVFDRKKPMIIMAKSRREAREIGKEAVTAGKYQMWQYYHPCEITSIQPFIVDYFFHNKFVD